MQGAPEKVAEFRIGITENIWPRKSVQIFLES